MKIFYLTRNGKYIQNNGSYKKTFVTSELKKMVLNDVSNRQTRYSLSANFETIMCVIHDTMCVIHDTMCVIHDIAP